MNVLVSNDDGVEGEGLKALVAGLAKRHKVYVLAPDTNRSAASNHFSLFMKPLKIKKVAENVYSCSGTPVDCVITALTSPLFDVKFDVVVSGINKGQNVGRDIVYSGTCAAARQAVFEGLPGIAASVFCEDWSEEGQKNLHFEAMAEFVSRNLSQLVKLCELSKRPSFVNINGDSLTSYKGVKYTSTLCVKDYDDKVSLKKTDDGFETVFVDALTSPDYEADSDYELCKEGYIAVSKVIADSVSKDVSPDFIKDLNLSL